MHLHKNLYGFFQETLIISEFIRLFVPLIFQFPVFDTFFYKKI